MKVLTPVVALATAVFFGLGATARADGITAVIKNPSTIYRLDATTGAFKGSITVRDAVSVSCDGQTIAVLVANGTVSRYDAQTGAFKGSTFVSGDPQSVQVSGGVIAVRTANEIKRYDASTGGFLGSSSI